MVEQEHPIPEIVIQSRWKDRAPFADEEILGIRVAQNRIVVTARPRSTTVNAQIYSVDLVIENRVQLVDAVLPMSSLTVRGDASSNRHTVTVSAAGGRIAASSRDLTLEALSAEVDAGEDDLRITKASVAAAGSHVEVRGTLRDFDAPAIDAHVQTLQGIFDSGG